MNEKLDDLVYREKSRKPTSTGWVCPSCGRGNAPWKSTCDCVTEWQWPLTPSEYDYPGHWVPPTYPYWQRWTVTC